MSQREAVPTYKQRVLEALRAAGERGVCLADVDRDLAHTLRNRCGELAREGHHIERRSCMWHDHRSATVARYILRPTGETSAAGSGTTPKPFEANGHGGGGHTNSAAAPPGEEPELLSYPTRSGHGGMPR